MDKFQNKIISKVFVYETRRTGARVLLTVISFVALFFLSVFCFQVVFDAFVEQHTLDVLELFQEDWEIIHTYFWDITSTIYQDIPKTQSLVLLLSISLIAIIIFLVGRNFAKTKNRSRAIFKYWFQKEKVK